MSTNGIENLEGAESTHNTKISDSGYSNSCSNSRSQRSGSSKSRHSGSSGSSGYGGKGNNQAGAAAPIPHPQIKRTKEKDRKKKKLKVSTEFTAAPANALGEEDAAATGKSSITAGGTCEAANVTTSAAPAAGLPEDATCHVAEAGGSLLAIKSEDPVVNDNLTPQCSNRAKDIYKLHNALPGPPPPLCGAAAADESTDTDADDSGAVFEQLTGTIPEAPDSFFCVVSLNDGVVLFTAPSITNTLGFPRDMWLGRSFINFVHPKDRAMFGSQITSKAVVPLVESKGTAGHKDLKTTIYVELRRYRGLKSAGFGVTGTSVIYDPYRLVLTFKEPPPDIIPVTGNKMLLIISATKVKSVYTESHERLEEKDLKFSTRHSTSGALNYIDGSSVEYTGYLPQELMGRSVMELYHPEDMAILKETYEIILAKEQSGGEPYESRPYRFQIKNGCYIVLKTQWTTFVNPWSRVLEVVIGNHHVIEGPSNPDVFAAGYYCNNHVDIPNDVLREAKEVEQELLGLLRQPIAKPTDLVKQEISKRCKALASFMQEVMEEQAPPEPKPNVVDSEVSFTERDSIMLGDISPYHESCESKSSSETPPSYNQLNYNDNLQRFFDSRPIMNIQETFKMDSSGGANTEIMDERTNARPNQRFSGSGGGSGGSAGNFSSESNIQMGSSTHTTTNTDTSSGSNKPATLTEELLYKHNEDMQKVMLKRHREARTLARVSDKNRKGPPDKVYACIVAHGVKRGSSHSWEGDIHKSLKHQHNPDATADYHPHPPNPQPILKPAQLLPSPMIETCQSMMTTTSVTLNTQLAPVSVAYNLSRPGELWPPFSVSVTTIQSAQTTATTNIVASPNMFPTLYYIPAAPPQQPTITTPATAMEVPRLNSMPMPYMAGVMYPHPQLYQQSVMYPPMMYQAMPYQPAPPPCGLSAEARNWQSQQQPHQHSHQQQPHTSRVNESLKQIFLEGTIVAPYIRKQTLPSIPPPSGGGCQSQTLFQRPPSQATSAKAEPGSNMGSIASASVVNRAFSECSKKGFADSPVISNDFQLEDMDKVRSVEHKTAGVPGEISDDMDESSFSSFYSSFLKTDNSSDCMGTDKKGSTEMIWDSATNNVSRMKRRPNPPWLDNVSQTKDLIYRYQITERSVQELLDSDMSFLKNFSQPIMVNDQLGQLYQDLELEGLSAKLSLSEATSGSSSDDCETQTKVKISKRSMKYSKLVMIYEENAPFPPPLIK